MGVPPAAPLRLQFSHPMDAASVVQGLHIDPPPQGGIEVVSRWEYVYHTSGWLPATDYTITLSGARSESGEPMPVEWEIHFGTHEGGRVPLPILMYHRLKYQPATASKWVLEMTTTPENFLAHLTYLHDHDYHPVSLSDLRSYLDESTVLPPKPLSITFDDGYKEFYDIAWPALKEFGYTAAEFITVAQVGYGAYLSWPQIKEMDRAGITFGSHTVNHPYLKGLAPEDLAWQLEESKRQLDAHLAKPVIWFNYPFGAFDETVIEAVQLAGYELAVTINPSSYQYRGRPYRFNRIHFPYHATIDDFAARFP